MEHTFPQNKKKLQNKAERNKEITHLKTIGGSSGQRQKRCDAIFKKKQYKDNNKGTKK